MGSLTIPRPTSAQKDKKSALIRRVTGLFRRNNSTLPATAPDYTSSEGLSPFDDPTTTRLGRLRPGHLMRARSFFGRCRPAQQVTKVTSPYQLKEPVGREPPPQYSVLGLSETQNTQDPQNSRTFVASRASDGYQAAASDWSVHTSNSAVTTPTTLNFPEVDQRFPVMPFLFFDDDYDISCVEHAQPRIQSSSSASSNDIEPIQTQLASDFILRETESRELCQESARRTKQCRIAEIRAEVDTSLAYTLHLQMQNEVACR